MKKINILNKKSSVNLKLAKQFGLTENTIHKIEDLHRKREDYYNRMLIAPESDLKVWDKLCEELEFELQDLWKFDRNINFHKFWNRPRCLCPKMDNDDRYPTGNYVTMEDCPLHGK